MTWRIWPRRVRSAGGAVAGLVLVVGLLLSAGIYLVLHRAEDRAAAQAIDRRTIAAQVSVEAEAQRYVDAMRLTAAGLAARPDLDADLFEAVTAPLAQMNLRGATAAVFLVSAVSGQEGAVQQFWRARGVDGLTLQPVGAGAGILNEHIYPVLRRSLDNSTTPAGVDVTQLREPTEALLRARASNATTVSDPYVLLRDRSLPAALQQRSFVLTLPVRAADGAFRGWLLLGMRGGDFLAGVLADVTQGTFDVSVLAGAGDVEVSRAAHGGGRDLHREDVVTVADRSWLLRTSAARSALPGAETHLDEGMTAAALLLTVLMVALAYVLATRRERLETQVRAATAEARAAEGEARRQAGLLGAVMDSISDGVGVVNERGEFLLHNAAARTLLGVGDDAERAEQWQDHYGILRPDGTPYPGEELPLMRALHGEAATDVEMIIRNPAVPDGVWINVSARPLDPRAGQRGAVAVFHDITGRRRAQEAIERLNGQLERRVAERTTELRAQAAELAEQAEQLRTANAELESFSYSVSHDLRAPLRAVDGFAKMLVLDHADQLDADGRRYLDRVRAGAQQMGQLIDGLLAFSRLQRQAMSHGPVRISTLVDDVWEELAADREGRDVRLVTGPLPPAAGDPRLLRHVLANLLGNAVKYTRGRAEARIEVGTEPGPDGQVTYFVRDNGTGFDMRYADKLFKVFQRLHRAEEYEGTGIGLALAYRIVHRHGGRIWADGKPDGGATFYFTLASPGPAPVPAGARPTAEEG